MIENFFFIISPKQDLVVVSYYKYASDSDTSTNVDADKWVLSLTLTEKWSEFKVQEQTFLISKKDHWQIRTKYCKKKLIMVCK